MNRLGITSSHTWRSTKFRLSGTSQSCSKLYSLCRVSEIMLSVRLLATFQVRNELSYPRTWNGLRWSRLNADIHGGLWAAVCRVVCLTTHRRPSDQIKRHSTLRNPDQKLDLIRWSEKLSDSTPFGTFHPRSIRLGVSMRPYPPSNMVEARLVFPQGEMLPEITLSPASYLSTAEYCFANWIDVDRDSQPCVDRAVWTEREWVSRWHAKIVKAHVEKKSYQILLVSSTWEWIGSTYSYVDL